MKTPTLSRVVGTIRPGAPMQLSVVLGESKWRLDLEPVSYRAADFKLEVVENGQSRFVDPGPPRTVEGTIRGLPGSRVLGVVKPSGLELTLILPSGKQLELRPYVGGKEKAGRDLYSLTPAAQGGRTKPRLEPGEDLSSQLNGLGFNKSTGNNCANLGACLARIIFDTDYLFYYANGSNTTQAMATVESLLAQVNERYAVLKIRFDLAQVKLRMDEASDPYDAPEITNSALLRDAIRDEWISTESSYDIDSVHLLAGRNVPGTGGESPINGICGSGKYTFSRVTGDSCSGAVIIAHELGHNLGS